MSENNKDHDRNGLLISGLDGSNPLAFLAALGLHQTLRLHYPKYNVLMQWAQTGGAWRPVLVNNPLEQDVFCPTLQQILCTLPRGPFQIDNKLPFETAKLRKNALDSLVIENHATRRTLDTLAAFGCDALSNAKEIFQDTKLRMIRAGDSGGNGFLAYARSICDDTSTSDLERALFKDWDYCDKGTALRLDPNEDRQYALRAGDPSKESTVSMRGANRLAIEGMALIYTAPVGKYLATAGFAEFGRNRVYWTWPVWECPLTLDTVKSVISSTLLQQESVNKVCLLSMGIVAAFRCRRMATSEYYNNLSPSFAVL